VASHAVQSQPVKLPKEVSFSYGKGLSYNMPVLNRDLPQQ